MEYNLKKIHGVSGWNVNAILSRKLCGCFYCLSIFSSSDIEGWIDEPADCPRGPGRIALCPKCDIDAALFERDQYKITGEFLDAMNKDWFS